MSDIEIHIAPPRRRLRLEPGRRAGDRNPGQGSRRVDPAASDDGWCGPPDRANRHKLGEGGA